MKALSIWQPWAWLILSKQMDLEGWHKYYENRTWPCHYKGPLLIHAAKTYSWEGHKFIERRGISVPDHLPMGGLVGLVTMVGCVTQSVNPFFFGPYGFVLRNPIPFEKMIPCRGYQRIFEVDFSLEVEIGNGVKLRGEVAGR